MQSASEQYHGYTIAVTPLRDHDDLWDFAYRVTRPDGGPAAAVTRSQTAGGHATPEAACVAGLQVARTEVDNLLALATPGAGSN